MADRYLMDGNKLLWHLDRVRAIGDRNAMLGTLELREFLLECPHVFSLVHSRGPAP